MAFRESSLEHVLQQPCSGLKLVYAQSKDGFESETRETAVLSRQIWISTMHLGKTIRLKHGGWWDCGRERMAGRGVVLDVGREMFVAKA